MIVEQSSKIQNLEKKLNAKKGKTTRCQLRKKEKLVDENEQPSFKKSALVGEQLTQISDQEAMTGRSSADSIVKSSSMGKIQDNQVGISQNAPDAELNSKKPLNLNTKRGGDQLKSNKDEKKDNNRRPPQSTTWNTKNSSHQQLKQYANRSMGNDLRTEYTDKSITTGSGQLSTYQILWQNSITHQKSTQQPQPQKLQSFHPNQ